MVLGFVEHDGGAVTETSLEMLTLASEIADETEAPLDAVVFDGEEGMADELGAHGVTDLHLVESDRLDSYAPEAWAKTVAQLADDLAADAVLAAGSVRGHEVFAHVAAQRDLPMASNCLAVTPGDVYELERQRWGGSLIEHARLDAETKLLTVAPHELGAEPDGGDVATVHSFSPELDESDFRVQIDRFEESDLEGVPLGEARVVVGGGRGVGGPDDFDQLEELADLLGGTVGASRAAVNEGWRPHADQIGLTGEKISPDLYVACGISGAVQHMVGCKGADSILAINSDPEAAIMQKADYAIVGDLHEVLPAINDAVADQQ